jgi:SAM-dependent methyltransferase
MAAGLVLGFFRGSAGHGTGDYAAGRSPKLLETSLSRRATPSTRTFTDYLEATADRSGMYALVAAHTGAQRVLYTVSNLDVRPSWTWPDVTYVDSDQRTKNAFADTASAIRLAAQHKSYEREPNIRFLGGDYNRVLGALPVASWDLVISLHPGPVGENAARCLKPGGWLLAKENTPDPDYRLNALVLHAKGKYRLVTDDLTRPAAAYLFQRVGSQEP